MRSAALKVENAKSDPDRQYPEYLGLGDVEERATPGRDHDRRLFRFELFPHLLVEADPGWK